MEGTWIRSPFENVLTSPVFPAAKCTRYYSWYYHMYGANVNGLRIFLISNGQEVKIWEKYGDQGNTWIRDEYMIAASRGAFQIKFVALAGTWWKSDIGLDELVLTSCRK